MGRKSPYPEEFRRDAVALYRASGGKRTYAAVAADLGITGETLRTWVRKDTGRPSPEPPGGSASSPAEEPARLRAENQRLLKAEREWQLERELLRRSAAYFAAAHGAGDRPASLSRPRQGGAVTPTWAPPGLRDSLRFCPGSRRGRHPGLSRRGPGRVPLCRSRPSR